MRCCVEGLTVVRRRSLVHFSPELAARLGLCVCALLTNETSSRVVITAAAQTGSSRGSRRSQYRIGEGQECLRTANFRRLRQDDLNFWHFYFAYFTDSTKLACKCGESRLAMVKSEKETLRYSYTTYRPQNSSTRFEGGPLST